MRHLTFFFVPGASRPALTTTTARTASTAANARTEQSKERERFFFNVPFHASILSEGVTLQPAAATANPVGPVSSATPRVRRESSGPSASRSARARTGQRAIT